MICLTWKPSQSGALEAGYLGTVRVAYVEQGNARLPGWLWRTNLLRPEGGVWHGRVPTAEEARHACAVAVGAWVEAAGLCLSAPPTEEPTTELCAAKTKVQRKSKKVLAASSTKA